MIIPTKLHWNPFARIEDTSPLQTSYLDEDRGYGRIDQKDLPLRDVVEKWLMACSIRRNEEVTEN